MREAIPAREWQIKFRALPDEAGGPDHVQRMRRLLKAALRQYGFCVQGLMVPSELPPVPDWLNPQRSEPPFAPPAVASERKQREARDEPP